VIGRDLAKKGVTFKSTATPDSRHLDFSMCRLPELSPSGVDLLLVFVLPATI